MPDLNLRWKWTEKQWQALNDPTRYLLWGGSKGAGKSVMLCRWAALQCLNTPGNRGFLGRQRSVDFSNTTLETFKKFVDANLYTINNQSKRIIFSNKSEIFFGGMDDQESIAKFNSAEFGFFGIDQAEEVEENAFALLCGTLRYVLPSGERPVYQARMTANPAKCWLIEKFIQAPSPDHKFIPALPRDNPFLPDDYIPKLREAFKHRPEMVEAYVEGSWDAMSDANIVFKPSWIREAIGRVLSFNDTRTVVACDPARFGDDETVIYVLRGRQIVDRMIYGQKSTMETAGNLVALKNRHKAKYIAVDSNGVGGGIVDRLRELGEQVLAINTAEAPTSDAAKTTYLNLRAQITWQASEEFAAGTVSIPADDIELSNQLGSIMYEVGSNGKIKIEEKAKMKERMSGRSPDRADAYIIGLHALSFINEKPAEFRRGVQTFRPQAGYGWEQRELSYA